MPHAWHLVACHQSHPGRHRQRKRIRATIEARDIQTDNLDRHATGTGQAETAEEEQASKGGHRPTGTSMEEAVTCLTTPAPASEQDIAIKLKGQVTDLKNLSTKKTHLQEKLDQTKAQYQTLLTEMQELQQKLNDGQQALKLLSEDYMKAVNKEPKPADLESSMDVDPLPAAVETFVANLGVSLSDEQKTQLRGLLKRPNDTDGDLSKRRKTDSPATATPPGSCG